MWERQFPPRLVVGLLVYFRELDFCSGFHRLKQSPEEGSVGVGVGGGSGDGKERGGGAREWWWCPGGHISPDLG